MCTDLSTVPQFQSTHLRGCDHMICDSPFYHIFTYLLQSTHPVSGYGSTFLHYCGLIGSHVVPIVHSVLSGLDNGPLLKREELEGPLRGPPIIVLLIVQHHV